MQGGVPGVSRHSGTRQDCLVLPNCLLAECLLVCVCVCVIDGTAVQRILGAAPTRSLLCAAGQAVPRESPHVGNGRGLEMLQEKPHLLFHSLPQKRRLACGFGPALGCSGRSQTPCQTLSFCLAFCLGSFF